MPRPRHGSAFKPVTLSGAMGVGALPREALERCLLLRIEDAAEQNTAWYLAQWRRGRDPECCPSCAGIRYVPRWESQIATIPEVQRKGACSCGPAVAYSLGHERAVLIRDGYSWDEAREEYYCELYPEGPKQYHAVMVTPDGTKDVTEKMKR